MPRALLSPTSIVADGRLDDNFTFFRVGLGATAGTSAVVELGTKEVVAEVGGPDVDDDVCASELLESTNGFSDPLPEEIWTQPNTKPTTVRKT